MNKKYILILLLFAPSVLHAMQRGEITGFTTGLFRCAELIDKNNQRITVSGILSEKPGAYNLTCEWQSDDETKTCVVKYKIVKNLFQEIKSGQADVTYDRVFLASIDAIAHLRLRIWVSKDPEFNPSDSVMIMVKENE